MKERSLAIPRARRAGLLAQDLIDEVVVYDRDRHTAHCLGSLAAEIWRRCDGEATASQIARALRAESGAKLDEGVVWLTAQRLSRVHLLQTRLGRGPNSPGRRELLRRAAAIGGLAVATISVPTAAMAATCLPAGSCVNHSCNNGGRSCCSGGCQQIGGQCGTGQTGYVCR
jgi:hypothetical protein